MKNQSKNHGHNYQKVIQKQIQTGEIQQIPGRITHITVLHDDWCGVFKGRICDCNPVIHTQYERASVDCSRFSKLGKFIQ